MRNHRIGDRVTIDAQECHVERLVIVPVVTFEPESATTPGATAWTLDQTELLAKGGGMAGRSRSDSSRFREVEANVEMTFEAGVLGMQAEALDLLHEL